MCHHISDICTDHTAQKNLTVKWLLQLCVESLWDAWDYDCEDAISDSAVFYHVAMG